MISPAKSNLISSVSIRAGAESPLVEEGVAPPRHEEDIHPPNSREKKMQALRMKCFIFNILSIGQFYHL